MKAARTADQARASPLMAEYLVALSGGEAVGEMSDDGGTARHSAGGGSL